MSLYSNFTLKDWLSLNLTTGDVDEFFRNALRTNDEPMAVLALAELIKRGDVDLVKFDIQEATDVGYIIPGSHFAVVFSNALVHYGNRDPLLRRINKNVQRNGSWPKTAAELFRDEKSIVRKYPIPKNNVQPFDGRLDEFLNCFRRDGWFWVEFGIFVHATEWDPHCKEHTSVNAGESYHLTIRDGNVLNEKEIPSVLSILDAAGIEEALPAFNGEELDFYTLDDEGNWVKSELEEDGIFYVTYYPVE
ncbi:hypothetical protein IKF92_00540 [Candidatus Saccharibacteria bacterium]|nr:hypothetical protein [Candidatus Saccharibacteria bacterium]